MSVEALPSHSASREIFTGLAHYSWQELSLSATAIGGIKGRYRVRAYGHFSTEEPHPVCDRILDLASSTTSPHPSLADAVMTLKESGFPYLHLESILALRAGRNRPSRPRPIKRVKSHYQTQSRSARLFSHESTAAA